MNASDGTVLAWREPSAAIRPFVSRLWTVDQRGLPVERPALERVLPTGEAHLVFRLTAEPLRVRAGDHQLITVGNVVVGGARANAYVKQVSGPSWSVGAQLRPGATLALFGTPAGELAGRHTAVDLLWGSGVESMREELAEAGGPRERLDVLEKLLAARLPVVRGLHPAIAEALERFRVVPDVRAAVEATGRGHRRFIELFRQHVGLTPKVFCRVQRFREALRMARRTQLPWVDVAAAAGYADQAHLSRDFREFAGVTPGEYRRRQPAFAHHVTERAISRESPGTRLSGSANRRSLI